MSMGVPVLQAESSGRGLEARNTGLEVWSAQVSLPVTLTLANAADFADLVIADGVSETGAVDWSISASLLVAILAGLGMGFFLVWAISRQSRRIAREQASELFEVAR